jgi:thiosulfate reductase cytochrome b subunit
MPMINPGQPKIRAIHPLPLRIMHWVNALAIVTMIGSGWQIYDASPLFGFNFPLSITIGQWLGAAIAWHLAAMWLLMLNGLAYLTWGMSSGHFRRKFLPLAPRKIITEFAAALRFKLPHQNGVYNQVQRAMYVGIIALGIIMVISGLAIWKPVQFSWLTDLCGGYFIARYVHFFAMSLIVAFIIIHLLLVALVPKVLWPMIAGGQVKEAP